MDSFAVGYKAAATLTPENMLHPYAPARAARLDRTEFGVGARLQSLRTDGGVSPHERNRAPGQPRKIRLNV
jgi:hypothetical protein